MINEKIKVLVKENKWIILAVIFFIVWKFFLISVMWHGRVTPPEPDDSYVYTSYIYSVKTCPHIICEYPSISMKNFTGFSYLSYRVIMGEIAKIFNFDPINLYHASFYIGILILIPALIFFLLALTENKKLVALSLFFLALYNGDGSYHGFFWVVPSFFMTLLFFCIFTIIFNEKNRGKKWMLYLLLLVPTFIYMHELSIYIMSIYLIYFVLCYIFKKAYSRNTLFKIIFTFFVAIAFYLPMEIHLHNAGNDNPYGVEKIFGDLKNELITAKKLAIAPNLKSDVQNISLNTASNQTSATNKPPASRLDAMLPGLNQFYNSYLKWLFPNLYGILLFLIIAALVVGYKDYRIFILYLSALLFCFISLFNNYGYRPLIILWPITYILYAYGFWYAYKFIKERKMPILTMLFFLALAIFISLNLAYSYFFADFVNQRNNISIDSQFTSYLLNHAKSNDGIFTFSKEAQAYALNTPLIDYDFPSISERAKYIVSLNETSGKITPGLNSFFNFVSRAFNVPRSINTTYISENKNFNNYSMEKEFDFNNDNIKIYRKSN